MATVYKRGATWWVRFQWRGTEVRRSARTSSKAVAQRMLARLLEEHRRLDRDGRPRRTYHEALERFCTEYLPNLKPTTQRRYRGNMRQLAPMFGGLHLDEITRGRLADYVTARLKGGAKGATVRRDLAMLSCLCSCAIIWDYLDTNPIRQFGKRHLKESPPKTTYPTVEEVERLVAHAPSTAGRIIRLLAQTGMRLDEVCSMEWSQVSIPRREIRLTKTKTSSPRVVPLSDGALGTIMGTPRHPTSLYVFWHDDGKRYTQFSGAFRKIAARAAVRFRCHDLRHHFASEFAQRTGDIAALQRILGHKTIAMTMRYSHLMTEHLHRAMQKHGEGERTNPGTVRADMDGKTVGDRVDDDPAHEVPTAHSQW
jgi:integrase/recombinase XerD